LLVCFGLMPKVAFSDGFVACVSVALVKILALLVSMKSSSNVSFEEIWGRVDWAMVEVNTYTQAMEGFRKPWVFWLWKWCGGIGNVATMKNRM
jgi:hypothetical protein